MSFCGFRLVKIVGESMRPRLAPGDYALFAPSGRIGIGDVVLAAHPEFGRIVKIVSARRGDSFTLKGANSASTSEARLGLVKREWILGRLVLDSNRRRSAPRRNERRRRFRPTA